MARYLLVLITSIYLSHLLMEGASAATIKVGRTRSRVGNLAGLSFLLEPGYQAWIDKIESDGGINVNGVQYTFEMKEYNDGSDDELMLILYDRLITVDKVNILFLPPFTVFGLAPLAALAENAGVVTFSMSALGASLLGIPNPQWIFSTFPSVLSSPATCITPLKESGAKSYIVALAFSDLKQLQPFYDQAFAAANITQVYSDIITDEMLASPTKLDDLIDKWKEANADVWVGGGILLQNIPLLNRMRQRQYNPPATIIWAAPDFRSYPAHLRWQMEGLLFSSNFQSSLSFPDPMWGNASIYADLILQKYNASASGVDAVTAVSGEILADAIKRAGSLSSTAIRDALLQTNISTMLGRAIFSPDTLSLSSEYFCFQVGKGGESTYVVNSVQDLVYPHTFEYPPGFLPTSHRKRTILITVLSVVGGLLLVLLLGLVIFFYFRSKFHVVFVRKDTQTEEWT